MCPPPAWPSCNCPRARARRRRAPARTARAIKAVQAEARGARGKTARAEMVEIHGNLSNIHLNRSMHIFCLIAEERLHKLAVYIS